MSHEIDTIPLDAVRINGGTQSRVELNQATIAEYAETIRAGVDLPAIITFFDGVHFWLADGFHRLHAHRSAGAMEISSEIRTGTQRDAILFSVGANASHGLRRTNEDKRRAVETLLNDPEWRTWTQARIAETCGVSREFVSRLSSVQEPSCDRSQDAVRVVQRNGTTYEQNTAKIGKSGSTADAPPQINEREQHPQSQSAPVDSGAPIAPPAATPPPVPFDEVQALREQLAEIAENMKSTLADNEMMGRVFDADDRLKAAMDEAKRQKAIADNAERTLASKSGEFIERARAVTHWMNRAQKAEKALAKLEAVK